MVFGDPLMTLNGKLNPELLAPFRARRVLAYHEISGERSQDVYQITPERFITQVTAAICTARKHRVELEFTFDDGHYSHAAIAAPVLESAGFRGSFFIPAARIEMSGSTATWSELRSLQAMGHTIGSHGNTHVLLTGCTDDELHEELITSRLTLEDKLGVRITAISMPGGRWDKRVAAACQQAGYEQMYTSQPGAAPLTSRSSQERLAISGRLAVLRKSRVATVCKYIAGDPYVCGSLIANFHLRSVIKQIVGDRVYGAVWRHVVRTATTT